MSRPRLIQTKTEVIDGQERTVQVFASKPSEEVELTAQPKGKRRNRWTREQEYRQIQRFASDIGSRVA